MSKIEELTKGQLVMLRKGVANAVLQSSAANVIASLVEQLRVKTTQYDTAFRERAKAESALQQASADRAALVARAEAAERAERDAEVAWKASRNSWKAKADAAEYEAAALRAEVERLRTAVSEACWLLSSNESKEGR